MNEKKAILTVSFGTSHLDTLEKTIGAIERRIAQSFPDYRVVRAFTSQMIINKLKRTEDLAVDNVKEALGRLAQEGVERVIVQPTHIINGIENAPHDGGHHGVYGPVSENQGGKTGAQQCG